MKQSESLVSILLPVCNASRFLEECLESLLRQTHKNIEIIAIDDFSRDDSYRILRNISRLDRRLRVYRNVKRYGVAITLNRAMKKVRGEFIAFMNPHDVSSLHRIRRQLNYLQSNPKTVACGTQTMIVNDAKKKLGKSDFFPSHEQLVHTLVTGRSIQYESLMINRRIIPKDILHFASNKYPFVFSEACIKLAQYGKIDNLNQHLYYHRNIKIGTKLTKSRIAHKATFAGLWVKSIMLYDYRPSLRTLLQPFINPVRGIFQ